jgi:hypothetical protein
MESRRVGLWPCHAAKGQLDYLWPVLSPQSLIVHLSFGFCPFISQSIIISGLEPCPYLSGFP